MADFSNTELRRLDLTLLLVFLGLLRLRKAAGVAAELGLTQSAVSQALRRLRAIFGDDLFLRRPHGMEPTAVALALEPAVRGAVEALRGALGSARAFDPAAASGIAWRRIRNTCTFQCLRGRWSDANAQASSWVI